MIPIDTDLTVHEWHAAVLGLGGVVPGAMAGAGQVEAAAAIAGPVVAVAFGLRRHFGGDSKAERTIRREPWYFLAVFVVAAVAAALAVATGVVA